MTKDDRNLQGITLYNFVSLRSPQNREKDDEEMKTDFIFCELVKSEKGILKIKSANDYESIDELVTFPEIKQIVEIGKKLNEYKYKEIDFYTIHHTLLKVEINPELEVEIKAIIWKALIKLTKGIGELKYKETLINVLKYFHLKKYKKLISHEKWDENIPNYLRLMNAQVVIPKELFPKEETFFYGEKFNTKNEKNYPSENLKVDYAIAILDYESTVPGIPEEQKAEYIDKIAKLKRQREKLAKESDSLDDIFQVPFVCSLLQNKYLLFKFEENHFVKDKTITKSEVEILDHGYQFLKTYEDTQFEDFDVYFQLTVEDENKILQSELQSLSIKGSIQLKNQSNYKFAVDLVRNNVTKKFYGESVIIIDDGLDFYGQAFPPTGYGVKQMGIAEYRKVVSTIARYIPAEVSNIENVMASEYKEKATINELTKEVTDFESSESSTENETESISTERFQMQNEISQIFSNENKTNFDTKLSASYGNVSLDVSYGTSTINSKTQSNNQAVTKAQEVTNKAVEKILTKVKKERTVKVTEKFTESNKHGFDNRGSSNHVSGVYRHINAVYKNQIHNYGRRLMYEFAVPEPALFHKLASQNKEELYEEISKISPPTNPSEFLKSYKDLNEQNIASYKSIFNTDLEDYPQKKTETKLFAANGGGGTQSPTETYTIPDEYEVNSYSTEFLDRPDWWNYGGVVEFLTHAGDQPTFNVYIENINVLSKAYLGNDMVVAGELLQQNIPVKLPNTNSFVVKVVAHQVEKFYINILITYLPTKEKIEKWQQAQYDKIIAKYKKSLEGYLKIIKEKIDNYNEEQAKKEKELTEDDMRQIESICLKKNCISYLISNEKINNVRKFGQNLLSNRNDLEKLHVQLTHKLDEYSAFARFLEQAFEWSLMSYTFYPFYWAKKSEWKDMYNSNSNDRTFKSFLQAGLARVIVSVKPGFENAVMYYMITGKIWEGGEVPTYGSSLFLSIAAELKEDPEYIVEKTWYSILPTNLIALQSSGVAIKQEGLPDLEYSGDLGELKDNPAKFPKRKKFFGLF